MITALSSFTMTTFAVMFNTAPIFVVFLGALCLRENVTSKDYLLVLLGFIAVSIIILGIFAVQDEPTDRHKDSKKFAQSNHFTLATFIALIATPLLQAGGTLIVRRMRKLNENTLSCYSNIACAIFGYVVIKITGMDATFVIDILINRPWTFMLFFITGSITFPIQIIKFRSTKHETASKLAVFSYLAVPY